MPEQYTFQLFAPNNMEAALITDFNDWQEIAMYKDADGYFRVGLELPDGDHAYRFRVRSKSWFNEEDQWVTVTDPYATNIDPETGNGILRIYEGNRIVDRYAWQNDGVPLPNNEQLVIYEMHVGDFSGGEADEFTRGTYSDVIDKLDHLKTLGINAIELMPLKTSPGDFNWGYSPVHYFAPEPSYGTTDQLKELIDRCHGLGIRVIADGVYNHASTENPLTQIDHDYWFRHEGKDPDQNWGPEFNYVYQDEERGLQPAMRFVTDSIRFWVGEYHIDGLRFDAARQIDNFDALRSFVATGRKAASMKPFFTVAEYIPPTPNVTEPAGPVESCWNDLFMHTILDHLNSPAVYFEKIKEALDPSMLGFAGSTSVTNYLANHDQDRLFRKLGEKGILDEELYRRAKLGVLILMSSVGVPMIWMGEEFGENSPVSENSNKINWRLMESEKNRDLFEYYRRLIEMRTHNAAFATANIEFFHEDQENSVLCFQRFDDRGNVAAVLLNLSDNDLEGYTVVGIPLNGPCSDVADGSRINIADGSWTGKLPRRSGIVLVSE